MVLGLGCLMDVPPPFFYMFHLYPTFPLSGYPMWLDSFSSPLLLMILIYRSKNDSISFSFLVTGVIRALSPKWSAYIMM